jgi:hypothetical protein
MIDMMFVESWIEAAGSEERESFYNLSQEGIAANGSVQNAEEAQD